MNQFNIGDKVKKRGFYIIWKITNFNNSKDEWSLEYGTTGTLSHAKLTLSTQELHADYILEEAALSTGQQLNLEDFYGYSGESTLYCSHEWVNYTGLRESFQFCTKCNEKKSD